MSAETGGRLVPSESSIGPRTGAALSTDADERALPVVLVDERDDRGGRERSLVAGQTALAAPATSAAASPPDTRVVFFVATFGKPS